MATDERSAERLDTITEERDALQRDNERMHAEMVEYRRWKRLARSTLDTITAERAEFYARPDDHRPVCVFRWEESRKMWLPSVSSCLGSCDFGPELEAYRRAAVWYAAQEQRGR